MLRTEKENCEYFYRVRIDKDHFINARQWCDSLDSDGMYWIVIAFGGYSHESDIIVEFGFSKKTDQMLFMLHWN